MSRGIPVGWTPTTRRGFTLFWATLFALSLLLQYASLIAPAQVAANTVGNQNVGGFEIDGNLFSGNMTPSGFDWAQGTGGTGLVTGPTFEDPVGNADTTNFSQGSKENDDPLTWQGGTGTASPKDDIGNVFVFSELQPLPAQPDSHLWTYLGVERASNNGTTYFDFEFNQKSNVTNSSGISVPNRTVGDVLVVAQQQGTSAFTISATVQRWQGSSWSSPVSLSDGEFYGLSNDAPIPVPSTSGWTDNIASGGMIPQSQFAEMAFDFTAFGGVLSCPSAGYAQVNVRTRSSITANAALKDYVGSPVNIPSNCGSIQINKQDSANHPLGGATFSISPNPQTGSTTPLVVTDNGLVDQNAADGIILVKNAKAGTYTITETAAPPGYLLPTPSSQTVTVQAFTAASVTFHDPKASLSLAKVADPTVIHSGDAVTYSYTVTNTGEVTLSDIAISDDHATGISCDSTSLDPGQSTTCHVTVDISQDTINTAHANGSAQGSTFQSNDATAGVQVISAALSLRKVGSATAVEAGTTVTYTYTVSNTGNDTVSGIALSDDQFGTITCPKSDLSSGESMTCTASASITTDTTNHATASGTDSLGGKVDSNQAQWTVNILVPGLQIAKSADKTLIESGDPVTYTYHVTNSGEVAISNIAIVDDRLSGATCGSTELSAGSSTDCTATANLTADTTNVAYATGTSAAGADVSSNTSTWTVDVIHPHLHLVKDVSTHLVPSSTDGTDVIYTYTVTNDGDSAISNLQIVDDKLSGISCVSTSLPKNASTTCSGTAKIYDHAVTNTAYATGLDELSNPVQSNTDQQTVYVLAPSLSLTKTGSTTSVVGSGPVTYTYHVTNTTVVPQGVDSSAGTITGINLNDNVLGSIACPDTALAAGASMDCTAGTTISQDTTNTAQASGVDFFGSTVNSNKAYWTVTVTPPPAHLTLVKNVVNTGGGTAVKTSWTLTATATGSNSPALSGAGGASGDLPAGSYVLSESGGVQNYAAGSWSCDGGSLEVSTGTVTLNAGQTATCQITNTYVVPGTPHVTISKLVNGSSAVTIAGGVATSLTYTIEVKNIGDATTSTDYAILDSAFPSFYAISSVSWTKNGGASNASSASALMSTSGIDVGLLNPGDDVVVTVVGQASPAAANAGPFTNTAKVCPIVNETTSTDGCLTGTANVSVSYTPPVCTNCGPVVTPTPTPTATPTPTPTGSVAGVTSPPKPTLPPTDTLGRTGSSTTGSNYGLLLVLFAGLMTLMGVLTPVRVTNRRDRRG